MTNFVYGGLGVLGVLALLGIGAFLGWKRRRAYDRHNRKVVREGVTEEQKESAGVLENAVDSLHLFYRAIRAYYAAER